MDAPFIDDSMADSGTAINILRQKYPGMFGGGNAPPDPRFNSGAPTIPASTSVDPNTIPQPDLGNKADKLSAIVQGGLSAATTPNKFNLPWLPGYKPPQPAPSTQPLTDATGRMVPGLTWKQKAQVLIPAAIKGALAGRASSEEAILASGGRRSGGAGMGFEAGLNAPAQQSQIAQTLQRGGLENQILGAQAQYAPQMQVLNFSKTLADIQEKLATAGKATAEAGAIPMKSALEQAQTLAARYKEDPGSGQLIDLQTGQPYGSSTGLAPLSAEEASVLGKQEGDRVPIKLKNTASEIVNRGIKSVSAGGRQLLVDGQGNTIKDLGQATPLSVVNATMGAFGNPASPEVQALVHQVGQGKVDLPTALSSMRRNPAAAASFMGALFQQYPDYNQANFGVSKKTMEYFTTGKGADELNAFRTAIAHADLLDKAATALQNKDTKAFNTIKNTLKTQFGDPEPTNFNVIANAYTREVTKALSAGHITNSEVDTQGATMPQNAGPKQIHGAVEAYKNLMASKAQQRMVQYEQGLQAKPAFPNTAGAGNASKFSQVKPGVMVEQ